jgi:perosamine synthetase
MDQADALVEKRREIARFYSSRLNRYKDYLYLPIEMDYAKSSYWMYHIILRDALVLKRSQIMNSLKDVGVETREGFIPYNMQEIFINRGWTKPEDCPNANMVAYASFYLPTGPAISEVELDYVSTKLCSILDGLI